MSDPDRIAEAKAFLREAVRIEAEEIKMCSFTSAEIVELNPPDNEEERLAIECLARVASRHPPFQFELPDSIYRDMITTGIRPSFIGRHLTRIAARAHEMRQTQRA